MIIAIQGTKGSFHEEAATKLVPGCKILDCIDFHHVFEAVDSGAADNGIVAIENNIYGSINAVYQLLERYELQIVSEVSLNIQQYLISKGPNSLEDINTPNSIIMSQAPALAQCEQWLNKHIPLATRQETHDTAAAVKKAVCADDINHFAVASKRASDLYGGNVLAGPINDTPDNFTRFILISKTAAPQTKSNRTSLILTTNHTPGSLYRALGVFNKTQINLSRLDSHPIVSDKRRYAFYIDCETGVNDPAMQNALGELVSQGCRYKILGSYFHES